MGVKAKRQKGAAAGGGRGGGYGADDAPPAPSSELSADGVGAASDRPTSSAPTSAARSSGFRARFARGGFSPPRSAAAICRAAICAPSCCEPGCAMCQELPKYGRWRTPGRAATRKLEPAKPSASWIPRPAVWLPTPRRAPRCAGAAPARRAGPSLCHARQTQSTRPRSQAEDRCASTSAISSSGRREELESLALPGARFPRGSRPKSPTWPWVRARELLSACSRVCQYMSGSHSHMPQCCTTVLVPNPICRVLKYRSRCNIDSQRTSKLFSRRQLYRVLFGGVTAIVEDVYTAPGAFWILVSPFICSVLATLIVAERG